MVWWGLSEWWMFCPDTYSCAFKNSHWCSDLFQRYLSGLFAAFGWYYQLNCFSVAVNMLIFQGFFNRYLDLDFPNKDIWKCTAHRHLKRLLVWGTSGFAPSNGMPSRGYWKLVPFVLYFLFYSFWAHRSNYVEEQFWKQAERLYFEY